MTSRNDITGDRLINKTLSKEGEDNWDRIFKKEGIKLNEEELANVEIIADIVQHHHNKKKYNFEKLKETIKEHDELFKMLKDSEQEVLPEYELNRSTGEVQKKNG